MAYNAIGGFPAQQHSTTRTDWVGKCKDKVLETKEIKDIHRKHENHVFLVYLHINKINKHVYVGITHHANPNKRWGYSGQLYTHCRKFLNAIKKYGWNNFEHIILCRTNKERAITLERTLIAHYKRLGISYNIADGGEGAQAISRETKELLHKIKSANPPMKGKHHTPEARALIAEAGKNRVMKESTRKLLQEKVWSKMKGVHREISEEARKKMSKSRSFPVLQLDLEGNVIREFKSTIEADKFFSNGKRQNHIADVCNGKRNTAHGYKWAYKEERRTV
jgi:group I intron endonuclease